MAQTTQTMPHAIKLPVPAPYRGEMDYEIIEAWIFSLDQYFLLTGLTEEVQRARYIVVVKCCIVVT